MSGAPSPRLDVASWRAERILFDDGGLLVVDKPARIPTYGGDETLRHGVTERLGDWLEARGRSPRLGVHQRLDQDTSGVLLFTTDPGQDRAVATALETRELGRVYRAVVSDPKEVLRDGLIELLLTDDGKRAEVVAAGGKPAVTQLSVLERVGPRADVELHLETGRLHQIRVTLAHLGAPVLGDRLYGGAAAERLFLHAWRVSGGPLRAPVEAPLPPAFARALRAAPVWPQSETESRSVVRDALCHRAPLLALTNAVRVLHGTVDGLPGIELDLYGAFGRLSQQEATSLSAVELGWLLDELEQHGVLGVWAADSGAWHGQSPSGPIAIEEVGRQFELSAGADGIAAFPLALRELRHRADAWASGGPVLAVAAAVGTVALAAKTAVASVTVVDRSQQALARLRACAPEASAGARLLCEEPLAFLQREARRTASYALVILDLTAARGDRDRTRLLQSALSVTAPGGKLVVGRSPTKMGTRQLRRLLHTSAEALGRTVRFAKEVPRPFDFEAPGDDVWPEKALLVELG